MPIPAVAGGDVAKRKDVSVKMDGAVIADARIAAAFKGVSLAEYLSESLRPVVARDIEEGYARRSQTAPGKPAPKREGGGR